VDQVGIKPLDTLRWATRNMASLMQMEGQLGTIAPDALADLVVLRDDPSDDVTILQDPAANVLAVLKDGEFVVDRLPVA
jgi:imidazolonepropionase-like amidohydrolase